ncbi:phage major capsid protein [Candidatus Bathyarchaeota archaeon]|nr:phage major capsid protein [Candidatus Bathyarchaeota archaeon]
MLTVVAVKLRLVEDILEAVSQKPVLRIKGVALKAGVSRNLNVYVEEELKRAAETLRGKPVYYEHVSADRAVGKVVDAWWDEEQKAIMYLAEIYDEETADKIRLGLIRKVSVALDYEVIEPVDGKLPKGIEFRELSLVAVPGVPETSIEVVERLSKPVEEGAVGYRKYPLADEDREWDAEAARMRIRRWASSDGSGDRDKVDWRRYRQAFAWFDESDPESFDSYKLPHHDVVDGRLVTVWRGVVAAMASLLGARGGVDIPAEDRRAVYSHLAAHYQDFGREPPRFEESLSRLGAMTPEPQPQGVEPSSAGDLREEVKGNMSSKVDYETEPKGIVEESKDPLAEGRRRFLESLKRGVLREQWEAPLSYPEKPSARISSFIRRSSILSGKPGETVNIPYVAPFEMDVLSEVGGSLTPKTNLYGTVQASIKEAAAYTEIPYADIEKLSEDLLSELEARFSDAALRAVDRYILDTLIADDTIPELDKSGESVSFDAGWIIDAIGKLEQNGKAVDPGSCLLVVSPGMYENLLKGLVENQALVYARPDVAREGRVVELFGVRVAVSGYMPEWDTTNHYLSAYLIHRDAMVFAPKRQLLIETERDTVSRKVKLTGSLTFAVAIVDKNAIVEIKTPATV